MPEQTLTDLIESNTFAPVSKTPSRSETVAAEILTDIIREGHSEKPEKCPVCGQLPRKSRKAYMREYMRNRRKK